MWYLSPKILIIFKCTISLSMVNQNLSLQYKRKHILFALLIIVTCSNKCMLFALHFIQECADFIDCMFNSFHVSNAICHGKIALLTWRELMRIIYISLRIAAFQSSWRTQRTLVISYTWYHFTSAYCIFYSRLQCRNENTVL